MHMLHVHVWRTQHATRAVCALQAEHTAVSALYVCWQAQQFCRHQMQCLVAPALIVAMPESSRVHVPLQIAVQGRFQTILVHVSN